MIGRAAEDRRAVRRRALRHGHAGAARRLRADLGRRGAALLAGGDPARARARPRLPASWPRSTGTWSGRSSSRASITPTTSGSTTASASGHARPVREHFHAGLDYQDKLARFLENHDEPRAAAAFPPGGPPRPRRSSPSCRPGMRFFHQGQFEGRKKRISPHLGRGPDEPVDQELRAVLRPAPRRAAPAGRSRRPVAVARMRARLGRELDLRLLRGVRLARPAGGALLVAVNYAANQSQCYVRLPFADLGGRWRLQDQTRRREPTTRRRRPELPRPVPGRAPLAGPCVPP